MKKFFQTLNFSAKYDESQEIFLVYQGNVLIAKLRIDMSAIDKEKIFVELRKYHTEEFPEKFTTEEMQSLRDDFLIIEEDIVTMLLSLVNGKLGFVDFEKELKDFEGKVKSVKPTSKVEEKDRDFFITKIALLNDLLLIAKNAIFKLKVPRVAKAAKS